MLRLLEISEQPHSMKILNLGSLCIDNVYAVPYFVKPGETLACTNYEVHAGAKGLNQSLALAHAGAAVWHAGKVGRDGSWLVDLMADAGVETSLIEIADHPSGQANIQSTRSH
jgi:ribokinase